MSVAAPAATAEARATSARLDRLPETPTDASGTGGSSGGPSPAPDGTTATPCEVRWDFGARVRIRATAEGGSAFLDADGDGKNDTCATFKTSTDVPFDKPIGYLRIDEGCDRKAEHVVRAKPKGDGLWRITVQSGETLRTYVGIALPLFVMPAVPFYLLEGSPSGYVTRWEHDTLVEVTSKSAPRRRITLHHAPCDDPGACRARTTRITDDQDGDGEADVTLDVSYDAAGRITSVVRADRTGAATATVRYECG